MKDHSEFEAGLGLRSLGSFECFGVEGTHLLQCLLSSDIPSDTLRATLPCHLPPSWTSASMQGHGWQIRERGYVQGWGPLCVGPGWLSGVEGAWEPTTETRTTGDGPKHDLLKRMYLKLLH